MSGSFTVDASVFLSAANPGESGHLQSRRFLEAVGRSSAPLVLPTLVLPEVAAGYARSMGDPEIGAALAARISDIPDVILVVLDEPLAEDAVSIALQGGLKGSDAVYAATARRFGATLVTVDRQQRKRAPADVVARYPAEMLGE